MAYTQSQIDALRAAIASGALVVRHENTTTTYRSLAEMKEILADMVAEVSGKKPVTRTRANFSRGLEDDDNGEG